MSAAALCRSMAVLALVFAQPLQVDAHLALQCHNSPMELVSEVNGRFSADPNTIALSLRIQEENRAGEVSSPGNF